VRAPDGALSTMVSMTTSSLLATLSPARDEPTQARLPSEIRSAQDTSTSLTRLGHSTDDR
jgi:hypothetical protein